jgi:hypothetical protein
MVAFPSGHSEPSLPPEGKAPPGDHRGRAKIPVLDHGATTICRPRPPADIDELLIEVVTTSGRAAAVELRLQRDRVEVWHHGRRGGVFVRDVLRRWLSDPNVYRRALVVDEVAFSVDRMVDVAGRVAISLPDVTVWTIDPRSLLGLRARI